MISEDKIQELWDSIKPKIIELVKERRLRFWKLEASTKVTEACCAECGFQISDYPKRGFDIRAYGWSPSHKNNWWKYVRWGTDMGENSDPDFVALAQEIANEVQIFWDAKKREMVNDDTNKKR